MVFMLRDQHTSYDTLRALTIRQYTSMPSFW